MSELGPRASFTHRASFPLLYSLLDSPDYLDTIARHPAVPSRAGTDYSAYAPPSSPQQQQRRARPPLPALPTSLSSGSRSPAVSGATALLSDVLSDAASSVSRLSFRSGHSRRQRNRSALRHSSARVRADSETLPPLPPLPPTAPLRLTRSNDAPTTLESGEDDAAKETLSSEDYFDMSEGYHSAPSLLSTAPQTSSQDIVVVDQAEAQARRASAFMAREVERERVRAALRAHKQSGGQDSRAPSAAGETPAQTSRGATPRNHTSLPPLALPLSARPELPRQSQSDEIKQVCRRSVRLHRQQSDGALVPRSPDQPAPLVPLPAPPLAAAPTATPPQERRLSSLQSYNARAATFTDGAPFQRVNTSEYSPVAATMSTSQRRESAIKSFVQDVRQHVTRRLARRRHLQQRGETEGTLLGRKQSAGSSTSLWSILSTPNPSTAGHTAANSWVEVEGKHSGAASMDDLTTTAAARRSTSPPQQTSKKSKHHSLPPEVAAPSRPSPPDEDAEQGNAYESYGQAWHERRQGGSIRWRSKAMRVFSSGNVDGGGGGGGGGETRTSSRAARRVARSKWAEWLFAAILQRDSDPV